MSANTIETVSLPLEPLGAPATWRAAVEKAGGQCTCEGACGRSHRSKPQQRCGHTLTGGHRLHLTDAGALLCAACFDAQAAAQRRAARAAAPQVEPDGLFDL